VRIFQLKSFSRFARKEDIGDDLPIDAVERAEQGSVDANLGGEVVKQRVARPSRGKSGGYRTLILYRRGRRAVFSYGFANETTSRMMSSKP
jgi:hypothetical protein